MNSIIYLLTRLGEISILSLPTNISNLIQEPLGVVIPLLAEQHYADHQDHYEGGDDDDLIYITLKCPHYFRLISCGMD